MSFTIHRYPVHLIDVVYLANGRRVLMRPALPQDGELLRAFVQGLSSEARYFRFLTKFSELPQGIVDRFTRIDYQRHVALIAETVTRAGETMVGEARYVIDEQDPEIAEFALAVADDWRGMGLAGTLLERLVDHAASSGIRRIVGDAFATNTAIVTFAKRYGFTVTRSLGDSRLVRVVKDLVTHDQHAISVEQSLQEAAVAA
jgi:acetyltransferase